MSLRTSFAAALPALLLVLGGCEAQRAQQDPMPSATEGSSATNPHATATKADSEPALSGGPASGSVETLAGEWRVAAIDGGPLNESYGIALTGDDRSLWWAPRCAQQVRGYSISGQNIRFILPEDATGPRAGPPCLPGLPARLPDVMRALTSATAVTRTAQNGVLISGGGHSVLLFSQ